MDISTILDAIKYSDEKLVDYIFDFAESKVKEAVENERKEISRLLEDIPDSCVIGTWTRDSDGDSICEDDWPATLKCIAELVKTGKYRDELKLVDDAKRLLKRSR